MNSSNYIIENSENLESIIDELNETIYNGELTEIIEVTYAYDEMPDGTYWNKTLFSEFWWIYKCIDLNNSLILLKNKLKSKIEIIDLYLEKILKLKINNESEQIKTDLLIGSLKYVRNTVEMTLYWLPFELEKAWLAHNLNEHEIDSRVKIIQSLEKENFGWLIKDNPKEIALCYDYLIEKYEENKEKLSENEQEEYEKYLESIKKLIPEYKYIKKEKTEKINDSFLGIELSQEEYLKIFNLFFELYWSKIRAIASDVWNIYDWEKFLEFPKNNIKFKKLSLRRIFKLLLHEIEEHTISLENNRINIWNFRWAGNLNKSEWLAKLMESLFEWIPLDETEIIQSFPKILIWEMYNWDKFKRFLELNEKALWDDNTTVEKRFLRANRNLPFDYPCSQTKDTTYTRWIFEAIKRIKLWTKVSDMVLAKVNFDDIEKIKKLPRTSRVEQIKPLVIPELLYYLIKNIKEKWNNFKVNRKDFIKHLRKRFPDIIDFQDEENIPYISITQQKFMMKIVHIIEWEVATNDDNYTPRSAVKYFNEEVKVLLAT